MTEEEIIEEESFEDDQTGSNNRESFTPSAPSDDQTSFNNDGIFTPTTPSDDQTGSNYEGLFTPSSSVDDPHIPAFENSISLFQSYVTDVDVQILPNKAIEVTIPSIILPLTLRVAYGFFETDILLTCWFMLDNYDWRKPPSSIEITNPQNSNYYGKSLVENAKTHFFSENYRPKKSYRSVPLLVSSQNESDDSIVQKIESAGYTHNQAVRASSLCGNDFEKSVTFLQTGQFPQEGQFELLLAYNDCPLLFFVLELVDAILDLQDHCAMCGVPTTIGLKPGVCTKDLCLHQFVTVGVGVSLIMEIKRDPYVADLLISVFCNCSRSKFFDPKPPLKPGQSFEKLISNLPKMNSIIHCRDDRELINEYGSDVVDLLRWIIFTCRSNFLMLPRKLEFKQFRSNHGSNRCFQFMALTASPEQENIFQQLKKIYGSRFLWHGSIVERWHRIIRQGLKNMTGTKYQLVGQACGPGIYFAPLSSTSIGYSPPAENLYAKSALGKFISITALCEVICLPIGQNVEVEVNVNGEKRMLKGALNDFGWCLTLTMNEASIVRFVFVNLSAKVDMGIQKLDNIPTLDQVLKLRAKIDE